MKNLHKIFSFAICVAMLTGCAGMKQDEPEPKMYTEPRYDLSAPIDLLVGRIDVVPEFTPSFTRPNVEHLFPVSIEKTAELWAKDRLRAVDFSSGRVAEFIIKDASVTEEIVKSNQLFDKDKLKYRAVLTVMLKISDPEKQTTAETSIEAWRELMIPVDTQISEKEKYWDQMVKKLFDAFNERMAASIHKSLNMYVKNNTLIREYL